MKESYEFALCSQKVISAPNSKDSARSFSRSSSKKVWTLNIVTKARGEEVIEDRVGEESLSIGAVENTLRIRGDFTPSVRFSV